MRRPWGISDFMSEENYKSNNTSPKIESPKPRNSRHDLAWGCGGCLFMAIYGIETIYMISQAHPLGFIMLGLAVFLVVSGGYMAKDLLEFKEKNKIYFSDDEKNDLFDE